MSRKQWTTVTAGPRKASSEVGPGDPARGAKVPRCRICGMPDRPASGLYSCMVSYIRFHVEATFCAKCLEDMRPDNAALDPLTLEEVA